MSSRDSPARHLLNPYEETLQSLCKKILKSRLFRGFYDERRYVEPVQGYRDVIALQRSERELQRLLIDLRDKLQAFYQHSAASMWVGITSGKLPNTTAQPDSLETYIWAELNEVAYGQYWFSIRNVRFRENEIILKLKVIRVVENEERQTSLRHSRAVSTTSVNSICSQPLVHVKDQETVTEASTSEQSTEASTLEQSHYAAQVGLHDFVQLVRGWGATSKYTVYNFMANDISKQNIASFLKFLGLVIVSLLAGGVQAVKFLGIFSLRFMFELSRLTHVLTPIILKMIDILNKVIGGFYILLTMIWRDVMVHRGKPTATNAVEYNRTIYRSIKDNVQQRQLPQPMPSYGRRSATEFERQYQ